MVLFSVIVKSKLFSILLTILFIILIDILLTKLFHFFNFYSSRQNFHYNKFFVCRCNRSRLQIIIIFYKFITSFVYFNWVFFIKCSLLPQKIINTSYKIIYFMELCFNLYPHPHLFFSYNNYLFLK